LRISTRRATIIDSNEEEKKAEDSIHLSCESDSNEIDEVA
jgi:hypothetical protein